MPTDIIKRAIGLLITLLTLFAISVSANERGITWLSSQVQPNGAYHTTNDIETPLQATLETLFTFSRFKPTAPPDLNASLDFVNANGFPTTRNLARTLLAHLATQPRFDATSIINDLISRLDDKYSVGDLAGYDGSITDTALTLEAAAQTLLITETPEIFYPVIDYLLKQQQADGSWFDHENVSPIYTTALVVKALWHYRAMLSHIPSLNVVAAIATATDYLYESQIEGGGWATDWETASALLALIPVTANALRYTPAANGLLSHQQADGSWDNDVYVTALALRALSYLAEQQQQQQQPSTDPNKGLLSGRVIDDQTGLPLTKVAVSLEQTPALETLTTSEGSFNFVDIAPGTYTVKYQLAGYSEASQSITVAAGQFLDLGTIRLRFLPKVGIIAGTITDRVTHQALAGVSVVAEGAISTSVQTDETGYYRIVSPPGSVNLTMSLTNYDSISGAGTVEQGVILSFSPALNPIGQVPPDSQAAIHGIVVDNDTGAPLSEVFITVAETDLSTRSDNDGVFSMLDLVPGELSLKVTLSGYQDKLFKVIAPAGSQVDLGTIHLPKIIPVPVTTLIGQVLDAGEGTPIQDAKVTVTELGQATLTDVDGRYLIEGIETSSFNVSTHALNYLATNQVVNLTEPGLITVNFRLTPVIPSPLEITAVTADQFSYSALTGAQITVTLHNQGDTDRSVRLYHIVLNEAEKIIEQKQSFIMSASDDPLTVATKSQLEAIIEWQTGRYLPGTYQFRVQAADAETTQLLSEYTIPVGIEPTTRIGGHVALNPPIAQLAAKQPIKITANIANQGNQQVEATTVTAHVTLRNAGYQQQFEALEIKSLVQEQGLDNPRGITQDAAGNFYVANYADDTVLKITPAGTVSTFATDIDDPVDVDLDKQGNVYVLSRYDKQFTVLGSDGSRTEVPTGIYSQDALEVLPDGRILIAASNALYAVTLAGEVTRLVTGGLNNPYGLAADSQGNVFVASSADNAVMKINQDTLSFFASEINKPYGVTVDAQDNVYVTSFGDNRLIKITPAGTVSTIATDLAGPYDVKVAPDGNLIVSNYNAHEIVEVTPAGEVSTLVPATIDRPSDLTYDAKGHLYASNSNRRNIVKLMATHIENRGVSSYYSPIEILVPDEEVLYWLESNGTLNKIAPGEDKTQLASRLSSPHTLIATRDGKDFLISQPSYHRISRVDDDGQVTTYAQAQFTDPPRSNMQQDSQGNLYILGGWREGYINQITPNGQVNQVVAGLEYPTSMVLDQAGYFIVSEAYNKVLRIDRPGNREVIAELSFRPHVIALGPDDKILVAEYSGRVIYAISAKNQVSEYVTLDNKINICSMVLDILDNLWISHCDSRITKLSNLGQGEQTTYRGFRNSQALVPDNQGGVFVSDYEGIRHLDSEGQVTEKVSPGILSRYQKGLVFDRKDKKIWVLSWDGILTRLNLEDYSLDKQFVSLNQPKGMAYAGDALIIANSGNHKIIRILDPNALIEIIAEGTYEHLAAVDEQTVLLANATSVNRLNVSNGEITPLVDGFSAISAVTVAPDGGGFVVADDRLNQLFFYTSDGTLQDSFVGLVKPRGLLFDSQQRLLVSNESPDGISQVRPDSRLVPFSSVQDVNYLWLEANGQLTVSRSGAMSTLSPTGEHLETYNLSWPQGLLRDSQGNLLVASESQDAILKVAPDHSYQKIASGLSDPQDIETDSSGKIYIADHARGVVTQLHADNTLTLIADDLPGAEALTFAPEGNWFVAYDQTRIAAFDPADTRTELPTTNLIPRWISGLILGHDNKLYGTMAQTNQLIQLHLQTAATSVQPGDIVYTATATLPELSLTGETATVDFGAWTPTVSGDYLVTVTAAEPQTTSQLSNSLHVGPSATATFSLAQTHVFPGYRSVAGYLKVLGADSTSLTRLDTEGATLATISGTRGYGIAADTQGNIYSVDQNRKRIVKIAPDGTVNDFVTNLRVGYGLAIDEQDNLYAPSHRNVFKITPPIEPSQPPQVTTFATLKGGVTAVAIGYDNQVYTVDGSNTLSRINASGEITPVTTLGLKSPQGLTLDPFGNFYVVNSNHSIIKITPEGKSALLFDQANFEFEGVNITADCSNNLLFAPARQYFAPLEKYIGEETTLVQLIGDTGAVREVLDGPSIDPAMADMDVLFYDRFNNRLLIWTDLNDGKIFSFPVICGSIDVAVHLKTRADVDFGSTDPTPNAVIDLADGRTEYIWELAADNLGQTIQLNLLFNALTEGETRAAADEAFLVFHNSFAPDEPVQVPFEIPSLLASRDLHLIPTLDAEQYGPNSPVAIQLEVINDSDVPFNGTLELSIVDDQDNLVAELPSVAVNELAQFSTQVYPSSWHTGSTYVGHYHLASRLRDETHIYDEATRYFEIIHLPNEPLLALRTTLDKPIYHTSETVIIDHLISALSTNAVVTEALLTTTITDPAGQVIHTDSRALAQLLPAGIQTVRTPYQLQQAALGTYMVTTVISDKEGQLVQQQDQFTVNNDLRLALVGQVTVQWERLTAGQTQICQETLTNQGSETVTAVPMRILLMELDTLGTVSSDTLSIDLGAGDSQHFEQSFEHTSLLPTHYACVLQAQLGAEWQTLDFKTFTVSKTLSSECSTVYAIHDQSLNDSQFFSYNLLNQVTSPLGPLHSNYDLEGLDIHPLTHQLHASSGKQHARLYEVDGGNGQLNLIGEIGFSYVESLSFHPDGSLWGWATEGLIRIDQQTGQGTLQYPTPVELAGLEIEGLAWDATGSQLYLTTYEEKHQHSLLWRYEATTLTPLCHNLPSNVESLAMRPDGQLVFGIHEQTDLSLHVYDIANCQVVSELQIKTPYHDIEAIAWPHVNCSANQQALQAFLTGLSKSKAFIGEAGQVRVTIEGQTYRGQLARETTMGSHHQDNQLHLKAISDVNEDGIDDFLISYPDGKQQVLYYLGTTSEL